MVVGITRVSREEPLEDVADTSGVVVAAIGSIQVDTIIASSIRVHIKILMEFSGENMRGY